MSITGVVMVARRSVTTGRVHAGKTVIIEVSDTDLVVACDDRTSGLPVRNLEADRPHKPARLRP